MDTSRLMSCTTLVGDKVRNTAGEDLGKIEDFVIDLNEGCIAYAVLSFGSILSKKLFAIPWSALALDEENKEFVLDADKERLKNAPGFDKDNWPDMADQEWGRRIHTFYNRTPYWEGERYSSRTLSRGSETAGDVCNECGQTIRTGTKSSRGSSGY